MPLSTDREARTIRRMMRLRGVRVVSSGGACIHAFTDTITDELGGGAVGPSDLPGTMRRVSPRTVLTCCTEDVDGWQPGDVLTVGDVEYRVWSQPLQENDGLTSRVYVVRAGS